MIQPITVKKRRVQQLIQFINNHILTERKNHITDNNRYFTKYLYIYLATYCLLVTSLGSLIV